MSRVEIVSKAGKKLGEIDDLSGTVTLTEEWQQILESRPEVPAEKGNADEMKLDEAAKKKGGKMDGKSDGKASKSGAGSKSPSVKPGGTKSGKSDGNYNY